MQQAVVDVAPRLPALPAGQGPPARPRRRAAVVGPVRPVGRGGRDRQLVARAREIVRRAFGGYSTGAGRPGRPGLRRAVDRRRAPRPASAAARSACRSSTTGRSCCSTGPTASTACRRWPTSWATPTTTSSSRNARRCSASCPMALAETASIFCETLVVAAGLERRDRAATSAWPCSTSTSRAPARWSSTSTAASCSRPRCSRRRRRRTLGVDELCELMLDAQARGLRRRARPRHPPPLDVGGEAPLLLAPTSTTGPTPTGCSSASGSTPATATTPTRFRAGYDDLLSTDRHGRRRRAGAPLRDRRARRPGSGRPASTCCGAASPTTRRWWPNARPDQVGSLPRDALALRPDPRRAGRDAGRRAALPGRAGVAGPLRAAGRARGPHVGPARRAPAGSPRSSRRPSAW